MSSQTDRDITIILHELGGDAHDTAVAHLLPLVYDELRELSQAYLRNERSDHTLQATALVHEAYIRLAGTDGAGWKDRTHFFRIAAKTMRRILINHARQHQSLKRGSGDRGLLLEETISIQPERGVDIVELDDALCRLAKIDQEKANVVELRVFAGCTTEQSAALLGVTTRTIERHLRFAKAWLRTELES